MAFFHQKLRDIHLWFKKQWAYASKTYEGKATGEFLSEKAIRLRKGASHFLYNSLFALLAALILRESEPIGRKIVVPRVGEIAEQDITSPLNAEFESKTAPRVRRDQVAKNLAPVFDYDDALLENWIRRWEQTFKKIREEYYSVKMVGNLSAHLDAVANRIFEITGQYLPNKDLQYLHQNRFSAPAERLFVELGEQLIGRLISPTNLFPLYYNTGIVIRLINQNLGETYIHDVSRVWSLEQARDFLAQLSAVSKKSKAQDQKMAGVISRVVVPNLRFNQDATQKRINAAMATARQEVIHLKRGQVIVQQGERISEHQVELLAYLKRMTSGTSSLKRFLISCLLFFLFFSVLFRMNITRHGFWYRPLKDALFFMGFTLITFLCVKYTIPYIRLFFLQFHLDTGVEYLIPISAGSIVLHLLMGRETAFTYALLVAVTIGNFLDQNLYFALWTFVVSAVAIQSIRACKQRTDLYKCGAWSGAVGALLVLAFFFTQSFSLRDFDWTSIGVSVGLAFFSGLLSAVLTSSLIPMLEALFGYTTSLKLLELSNFNHPLLHSLMMKAPGTYHHSVIVGSLAEIAADRVKANSLLARVSAYYHDIGKMTKPLYFIENQPPNNNPHDHLQASMSAKILFAHVKDGVRLGRDYNLGSKIIDIIEQHHGTTLVSYFFNKAKEVEKPDIDPVEESQFHYPGPRPQTREAAIVMLADACEASTRSIADPTAAKIQMMVKNIIKKRVLEEQFSECELTLSDLGVIEDSFTRTLVSLYHHRIEYPGQKSEVDRSSPTPQLSNVRKIQI